MERLLVSCLVLRFVIYKTEPSGGRGRAQLVQSCQENVVNMI